MRRWLAALLGLALLAFAITFAIGMAEEQRLPLVRRVTLPLAGLPAGAPPYRVALLSDIHLGNRGMQPERLARVVAMVNAEHPDLVLLAGDFVNGSHRLKTDPAQLAAGLKALKARDGVVAVLGNHDHDTDPAKVRAALAAAGITVLANEGLRVGPLAVLGLDDFHSRHADIAALERSRVALGGGAPVVVTHSPAVVPRLPATMPTVLAGHTHCGQIVLPWLGSPAEVFGTRKLNPHYRCGLIRDPGHTTLVTGGVGSGWPPIRIGAPTDFWIVTFAG